MHPSSRLGHVIKVLNVAFQCSLENVLFVDIQYNRKPTYLCHLFSVNTDFSLPILV